MRDVIARPTPAILQRWFRNLLSSIVCAPDSFELNPGTQGTSLPSRKRQGGRSLPEFSSSGGNAQGRAGTRRARYAGSLERGCARRAFVRSRSAAKLTSRRRPPSLEKRPNTLGGAETDVTAA